MPVREVEEVIKYRDFIKKYRPVMEENADGTKSVKYWGLEDPVVAETKRNHIWTYVSWNGAQYIVPGLRLEKATAFIITNEPWDIGDSGLVVNL